MKKNGFTIIELLVVMAIISLLSSIILTGVNQAREKGRATRILQDFTQIETALYALSSNQDRGSWWVEGINGFPPSNPVIDNSTFSGISTFLPTIPPSPVNGPAYQYDSDNSDIKGQSSCLSSNFRIGVNLQLKVTPAGRKYFEALDKTVDGSDGVHCGKIKWNSDSGNESIFYQITNHYSDL